MFPWADPYATKKTATLQPDVADAVVKAIADAVCAPWAKDGYVFNSVPQCRDPQTHQLVDGIKDAQTYQWWVCDRSKVGGLVKRIRISWGDAAKFDAGNHKLVFPHDGFKAPVFVAVTLDASRVAVDGPATKKGTTRFRLSTEAQVAAMTAHLATNIIVHFPKAQ